MSIISCGDLCVCMRGEEEWEREKHALEMHSQQISSTQHSIINHAECSIPETFQEHHWRSSFTKGIISTRYAPLLSVQYLVLSTFLHMHYR